jgi:hypothetical protein
VWEVAHEATGLPWWASIPLTTLALRGLLLPLTLKARAATVNFALMQQASAAGRALRERMASEAVAAAAPGGSSTGQAASSSSSSSESSSSTSDTSTSTSTSSTATIDSLPTARQLSARYLDYMRKHHGVPSLWWYAGNAAAQVNVFLAMSAALRQMAAVSWPGFESEGLLWFADMTAPAVQWGTWATAYGAAGALLPLAVFGAYVRTLEYTAAGAFVFDI